MKKIFFLIIFFGSLHSSEAPKTIIPNHKSFPRLSLEQFSVFNLNIQQLETQNPSNDEWSEKLTSVFDIWLDLDAKRAVVSQKKIRETRDLEKVVCPWPHHDKFSLRVRAERKNILSESKTEIMLKDKQNFKEPINLDAFGYLFTFTLPAVLPTDCVCQGLLVNPASRDFFGELNKNGRYCAGFKSSLAPAFSAILAANYRLLSLGKTLGKAE
jgi:hypothetical protein